jgi:hypothetical protein
MESFGSWVTGFNAQAPIAGNGYVRILTLPVVRLRDGPSEASPKFEA